MSSADKPGGSNTDTICAQPPEVLDIVTAVVWENKTDETDSDDLSSHSIEAIVYGGTDANIVIAVHTRRTAGIQIYGGQSTRVLGASGKLRTIKSPHLMPVLTYARISGLVTSGAYAGDVMLKAAIAEYIDGTVRDIVEGGLTIGETVYHSRLMCSVNDTPGVVGYMLEVNTDGRT